MIQVLVKFKADMNATDSSGETALHQVVKSIFTEKKRGTIKLLLKSGIDVNAENKGGYTAIQEAIKALEGEKVLDLLGQNIEAFPQSSRHQSIKTRCVDEEESNQVGRLIDASIKLRTAGLSTTIDNLIALARDPRKDYFSISQPNSRAKVNSCHFGGKKDELILECEEEIEKLKIHMLTDTMSLHDFMLTDSNRCVFSKSLLSSLQIVKYVDYPTYEDLLIDKFKKLLKTSSICS